MARKIAPLKERESRVLRNADMLRRGAKRKFDNLGAATRVHYRRIKGEATKPDGYKERDLTPKR